VGYDAFWLARFLKARGIEQGNEKKRHLLLQLKSIGPAIAERWSRLSEQIFRFDKWSVCRG